MKLLASELLKELYKHETKPSEYYVVKIDHGNGKPPEIMKVWQMRGREFIRYISPGEYPGIVRDQDLTIHIIESDQVSV